MAPKEARKSGEEEPEPIQTKADRKSGGIPSIPYIATLSFGKILVVVSVFVHVVGVIHSSISSSKTPQGSYTQTILVFDICSLVTLSLAQNYSCVPGILFFLLSVIASLYDTFVLTLTKFLSVCVFNTVLSICLVQYEQFERELLDHESDENKKRYGDRKSAMMKVLSNISGSGLGRSVLFCHGGGISYGFDIRATGFSMVALIFTFSEQKLLDIRVSDSDTNIDTSKFALSVFCFLLMAICLESISRVSGLLAQLWGETLWSRRLWWVWGLHSPLPLWSHQSCLEGWKTLRQKGHRISRNVWWKPLHLRLLWIQAPRWDSTSCRKNQGWFMPQQWWQQSSCTAEKSYIDSRYNYNEPPPTLLLPYPNLQSHRFIHGILSTETGPTIHFMSIYGFTGADVHIESQQHNEQLLSSAFEYAASFGNTPVYIGMDANTTDISSPSLSQAYLSQRWYDIGAHFPYLKNEQPQSTCYAKGTETGRRIDYIYANSQAVNAIQDFYLDLSIPIPTHRPLAITVDIPLFSAQITRLSLPPTCYSFPKPSSHFLDIFLSLFQWDISVFNGNVEEAYDCWNLWAQQYFTLLTNVDFHSRGKTPCLRKGLLALPTHKELPVAYRPYTILFNQTVSAISEISTNPMCLHTYRFTKFLTTIQSSAETLLPAFRTSDSPFEWLITLREQLINHRMNEQADIQRQRRVAWRSWTQDTWALNSKKIYQLVKGKFVEPFTCLYHEGTFITDRADIDLALQQAWNPIFAKYTDGENKAQEYRTSFYPTDSPHLPYNFPDPTLEDIQYVVSKKLKKDTATGLDGWRPSEFKQLPTCLLLALLDIYKLCESSGCFPSSSYYSYTTLIPKGSSRTPLSLRPITVLPVPYRVYASLRCQTLLKWQNSWIHPAQFAFCKGRSTTSMNSTLSFDLLHRYQTNGAFAGLQFDFMKCFDTIPYTIIWDTLSYYGCDTQFIDLLQHLYTHMHRCFRYAGCVGNFWSATNGLLQGDPLSVVILNCVLHPLLRQLSSLPDLTLYAFADDLTIVSSSWNTLEQAYQLLQLFCVSTDLVLNVSKCQIWNKGSPRGTYPPEFDRFTFRFYPFLLGSPIDIGVPYSDSVQQQDATILARARKITRLSLPYRVMYRLFVSLVSSCYNHYALSCDMTPAQSTSLKHAITSILVPKRSKWVCREALFSLTTPGHLLSPQLFLNYRHIIEYLLYVRQAAPSHRQHLSCLWNDTFHIKWGPFFRLRKAAHAFAFSFEDPLVLLIQDEAHSVDEPLDFLKHLIRDSYRQHFSYKLLNVDRTVMVKYTPLTLNLLVITIFHCTNLCNRHFYDKFLPGQLIIVVDCLRLISLIVLCVHFAMK